MSTATLRTGVYRYVDDRDPAYHEPPVYVHIRETASSFTLTWHPRSLEPYRGLIEGVYDGIHEPDPDAYGRDGDDYLYIIRRGSLGWMWKKPDGTCTTRFTIRKSGSQHAIAVWDDGSCTLYPYRNCPPCRFEWVSAKQHINIINSYKKGDSRCD